MTAHKDLAQGRWHTMSLAQQLGNTGSEYSRIRLAIQSSDKSRLEGATKRFFELIDLTLSDPRWKGPRLRELARLREEVAREVMNNKTSEDLQKYFDYFAIAARR